MKRKQKNPQPFVPFTLEEEKQLTPKKVFSVRMNEQEVLWLEEIKEDLNIKSDSRALKFSAWAGKNVLQRTFSRKILKYLFNPNREKLTDYKNY